jgi:hypothetical protein
MRNKNKCTSKPHWKLILIIVDSYVRGCAAEISNSLCKAFEVTGIVVPGSRLENITHLIHREISHLHLDDFVIIWGGANVINRN